MDLREMQGSLQSCLLKRMLSDGASVDMQEPLNKLLGYTDWEQAAERGRIVPHAGSDAKFDDAELQVQGFPHPHSTAGDDHYYNICMRDLQQKQQEDYQGSGCQDTDQQCLQS